MKIRTTKENISIDQIINLYKVNKWSAVEKPNKLFNALMHSDSLVTAWENEILIGLGNAISDGYLMVYYPHLLVLPKYQRKGVGKAIMKQMFNKYSGFHMQMLTADKNAILFYENLKFKKAGNTQPMWIYQGNEH